MSSINITEMTRTKQINPFVLQSKRTSSNMEGWMIRFGYRQVQVVGKPHLVWKERTDKIRANLEKSLRSMKRKDLQDL